MGFSDSFYKKVERKTNVNKETILSLAKKLQGDNLKDESKLRDLIHEIGSITGKDVPKEQEDKIIKAIVNDKTLIHFSYERYLENKLRESFELEGTPIVLQFKNRGE